MGNLILKNLSREVHELIYEKQSQLQKEKLRSVSLAQTVEVLLKDAYLRKKVKPQNG